MNWAGELCQKHVEPDDTVLDLGCGIMQATLNTIPTYPQTRLKCKEVVGVDIYRKYLELLKHEKDVLVIQADLRQPFPIKPKCADVVLLLDVVEHLPFKDALLLMKRTEELARKKVIVLTPSSWKPNDEGAMAYNLGYNEFQLHKCLLNPSILKLLGYKVSMKKTKQCNYSFGVNKVRLRILHVWDSIYLLKACFVKLFRVILLTEKK